MIRPPFYGREFGQALIRIGWFSSSGRPDGVFHRGGLGFADLRWRRTFNAEAVVPSIVAIGMVRELGPSWGA